MIGLIVCSVVLASNPPSTTPSNYTEARAQAGRSPEDQVRLALWCEAHGLTAERLHHLTLAVLADPKNAVARGLMGLVSVDGRWVRPEAVADRTTAEPSPLMADYVARRNDAPDTADGHWALAVWAAEHGLDDQARAHFASVTRLDPAREDAWKRLGHVKRDGRWIPEAQVASEDAEVLAQKLADQKWRPILGEFRRRLAIPSLREKAEAGLVEVTDPRAVPSIGRVFAATEAFEPWAVRLLGQVDSFGSTRGLAYLAAFARSADARRAAAETLRHRDPREYAEPLIALLAEPIRFEVKHVGGLIKPGELLVEGQRANVRRVYTPPTPFRPGDRIGVNDFGQSVVFRKMEPGATARVSVGALFGDPANPTRETVGIETLGRPREAAAVRRLMEADAPFRNFQPGTQLEIRFGDKAEIPMAQMAAEIRQTNAETERKLWADVKLLEDHNVGVRLANGRVADVLNAATGQAIEADRRPWSRWFVEQVGYSSASDDWSARFSVTQPVSIAYQPPALPDGSTRQVDGYRTVDCFAAGTLVQSAEGPRAIETLKVGDRGPDPEHVERLPGLSRHRPGPPQPRPGHLPGGPPGRAGRGQPGASVLGRRPGLGDGPGPENRRPDPDPRRRRARRLDRARRGPARLQPRRGRRRDLLRRPRRRPGPRQRPARPPARPLRPGQGALTWGRFLFRSTTAQGVPEITRDSCRPPTPTLPHEGGREPGASVSGPLFRSPPLVPPPQPSPTRGEGAGRKRVRAFFPVPSPLRGEG